MSSQSRYLMSDGRMYTLWTAELHTLRGKRMVIESRHVFRVSAMATDEEIPAVVCMRHLREKRLPREPDRIRESTGTEVSWYFSQHPTFLHRSQSTDVRFQRFANA